MRRFTLTFLLALLALSGLAASPPVPLYQGHFQGTGSASDFVGSGVGLTGVTASATVSSGVTNQWRIDATNAANFASRNSTNLASLQAIGVAALTDAANAANLASQNSTNLAKLQALGFALLSDATNAAAAATNKVAGIPEANIASLVGDLASKLSTNGSGSGVTSLTPANISAGRSDLLIVDASNVVAGGQLPLGTLATNSGSAGFLTETGDKRKYSTDGSALTGLAAGQLTGTVPAGQMPALTGDITTSAGSIATSLKSTGTAGSYTKVTFDAQGRETGGTTADVSSSDITGVLKASAFPAQTGDVTNSAGALASGLKATGTAGTYTKVTFDYAGRETSGTTLGIGDLPQGSTNQVIGQSGNPTAAAWTGNPAVSNLTALVSLNVKGPQTNSTLSTGVAHLDSNGALTSSAVDVSGADITGVLAAGRFPALTGDITTSSGALATTLKNTGTAGTYYKTTFDAQGRETSGATSLVLADIPTGQVLTNNETQPVNLAGQLTLTNSQKAYFGTTAKTNVTIDGSAGTVAIQNAALTGSPSRTSLLSVQDSLNTSISQLAIGHGSGNEYQLGRNSSNGYLRINGSQAAANGIELFTADGQYMTFLPSGLSATGTVSATSGIISLKNNLASPTSITVGASVFNYTNTQTVNIQVFLDANGATTAVSMNGTAIFSSLVGGDHTIILQPGDRIGVTYSVATPLMRYREF